MAMRANTSGSWRAIQRSFAVTSCWLIPLPAREKRRLVHFGAKLLDFRAAPPVALLDAWPEDTAVRVEQDDGGKHSGHADGGDRSRVAAGCDQFGRNLADIGPPFVRVLLRPADVAERSVTGRETGAKISPGRRSECRPSRSCRCRGRERSAIEVSPYRLAYPRLRVFARANARGSGSGLPHSRE